MMRPQYSAALALMLTQSMKHGYGQDIYGKNFITSNLTSTLGLPNRPSDKTLRKRARLKQKGGDKT